MVKLAMALDAVVRIRLEGAETRAEKLRTAQGASGGETVVSMAKFLEGRQKVETKMDSYEPMPTSGVR